MQFLINIRLPNEAMAFGAYTSPFGIFIIVGYAFNENICARHSLEANTHSQPLDLVLVLFGTQNNCVLPRLYQPPQRPYPPY